MDQNEAREALEQIAATRRNTAEHAASPKGYYAVAGFGMALVTVGLGVDGGMRWALYAIGLITMIMAMRWYSERTGIVAWATLREPGAWRAWIMAAVALVGVGVALALGLGAAIGAALVTWVVWSVVGPRWDAVWRRSLEAQP